MKRSREVLLWTFFLAICFWAGYLKGFLPLNFKPSIFVQGPARIYNATLFDFPKTFIKRLETELGQKVEVIRVKNWDELQGKMVTKNGAHVLLAPQHWGEDLAREDLLVALGPLQTKIEKRVSADFISLQEKKLISLPVYWTLTDFRVSQDSFPGLTLEQILADKNLSEVHLYPDLDMMASHLKIWSATSATNNLQRIKNIENAFPRGIPASLPKNTLWEVPHLMDIPGTRLVETHANQGLLVMALMVPRNSVSKKLSYQILDKMMDSDLEALVLKELPLGSALKESPGEVQITREQKSSRLRDLKLHELMLLERRVPQKVQEMQLKFNFGS